jgi:hypothetical protein
LKSFLYLDKDSLMVANTLEYLVSYIVLLMAFLSLLFIQLPVLLFFLVLVLPYYAILLPVLQSLYISFSLTFSPNPGFFNSVFGNFLMLVRVILMASLVTS